MSEPVKLPRKDLLNIIGVLESFDEKQGGPAFHLAQHLNALLISSDEQAFFLVTEKSFLAAQFVEQTVNGVLDLEHQLHQLREHISRVEQREEEHRARMAGLIDELRRSLGKREE